MSRERAPGDPGRTPGGPPCEIRAARPEDVPRVWEMVLGLAAYERLVPEVSGSANGLARDLFGPRPRVECLVADSGSGLVGYALFFPAYSSFQTAPTLWLEDLFVEPRARGTGTGRALFAAVAALALERGCVRLGWVVLDWNRPAIGFYERQGARPVEEGWKSYALDEGAMRTVAASVGSGRPA